MMYNVYTATRDIRVSLQLRSMAYNATNGGNQKGSRKSDAVVVPKKPGNAGGGKDGTQLDLV